MGRSSGTPKSILIATRVTPRINELIKQMAAREGLYVSEWVRKLITSELAERGMLDKGIFAPKSKVVNNDFDIDEETYLRKYE